MAPRDVPTREYFFIPVNMDSDSAEEILLELGHSWDGIARFRDGGAI
jgi:hypothetical protein